MVSVWIKLNNGLVLGCLDMMILGALTHLPRLLQTLQFDLNQNYRCEISPRPQSGPNSQTLVQQKEMVLVWIKLNHGSVSGQLQEGSGRLLEPGKEKN